jgi:serine kinase of HPr protein (carbohydrate metabolism regulator)
MQTIHATAISSQGAGVLIRGPSGSGKSDLALRCLSLSTGTLLPFPFELVSDDRVVVEREGDAVILSAPPTIAGLLEVRGLGVVPICPVASRAALKLVVNLVQSHEIERMPETTTAAIAGLNFPALALSPFESSAPLKLALALSRR